MNADAQILDSIPEKKPVKAYLPITGKSEMQRTQCVLEHLESPAFCLRFVVGEMPDNIDLSKGVVISVDMGGPTTSIEAAIISIPNIQTIELKAQKSITHEQMREFFRVDAVAPVISKFQPEHEGEEPWQIEGTSIDISGSGVLATFASPIPKTKFITLNITLPEGSGENETITIIAHQVRAQELEEGQHQVAFHFDQIDDEDRDKIIGCCLVLQRKSLRLRVQVYKEE
jgi:hypothetical protein